MISLADSQVLRWLDELNDITDADERARQIKAEIRNIRKEENSIQNRRRVRKLYTELDEIQYKPDYLCLIIDREKDYRRACKGFTINGIRYERLLGTPGGVKNSTVVFIASRHADEIKKRIENGRDVEKPLVPAKLEAYKALTCSASIPVSDPKGILVVNDCETTFRADTVYLSDENEGEPVMEFRPDTEVTLNACDGCGLMLPSIAERWSEELGLDYTMSGANSRYSWEKGMLFTFDYLDFAEKMAGGQYIVKDAWGDDVDVRETEIVLTTSMLKLWDSYDSCRDYIENCKENHYTFNVTKTSPKELENERTLNYQFIQSFDLDDDDIEELIGPTMQELHDVLHLDADKAVLFMKGVGLKAENAEFFPDDAAKALMVEPTLLGDAHVQNTLYQAIKNRINEAKVGVLNIHGNYSIISGDPFALCQSFFGLPVTGLLRAGEIYNKYWTDYGSEELLCFRAPMTTHSNIRRVVPNRTDDAAYWYRYLNTCTVLNAWDTMCAALNGADFDGDIVMLTDNPVLLRRYVDLPALMCIQRKAEKKIVEDADLIQANLNSFGDAIGKTTNWVTSMFEVQAGFEKDSAEYKTLDYRIQCGQLYQQAAIDKTKGILCKPMPRSWHDRHAANQIGDTEERRFYQSLVVDRKPYFMKYIYPQLSRDYNAYIKNTNKRSLREFGITMAELRELSQDELTDRQKDFLRYYEKGMPVGINNCVMNRICRRFEEEFDGRPWRNTANPFNCGLLKSDAEYTRSQYESVLRLYESYMSRLKGYSVFSSYERVDEDDMFSSLATLKSEFVAECDRVCPNKDVLCNIVIDMCYGKAGSKKFAWDMCGEQFVKNLLEKNGHVIHVPVADTNGNIAYHGERFSVVESKIGVEI